MCTPQFAVYFAFIQLKSPTNCNAHLAESIFRHALDSCLFHFCLFILRLDI
ncbi:DUF6783 domain-containing protein [Anaerobutyricum hallii]|uniref:DUF6783 domain-containing protein n=1 Tax=Anaerobutyricum hallii TaxID=39488 RepID=UPI003AB95EDE